MKEESRNAVEGGGGKRLKSIGGSQLVADGGLLRRSLMVLHFNKEHSIRWLRFCKNDITENCIIPNSLNTI